MRQFIIVYKAADHDKYYTYGGYFSADIKDAGPLGFDTALVRAKEIIKGTLISRDKLRLRIVR